MKKIIFALSVTVLISILYFHQKQDEPQKTMQQKSKVIDEYLEFVEKSKEKNETNTKSGKIREIRGKN